MLFDSLKLRRDIVREIRRLKPDLVITHDPLTRHFRQHPDHRAVGFATLATVFPACRLASFFAEHGAEGAEGLEPHVVHMLLLAGGDPADTNLWVDISETYDRKIAALELHESQVDAFVGGIRSRMQARAERMGEAFIYSWLD